MGTEIVPPKEGQDNTSQGESNLFSPELYENPTSTATDSTLDSTSQTNSLVDSASDSAQAGNTNGLEQSIESAFENAGGNPQEFGKFGDQLKQDLDGKGYDVRVGENTIDLRQDGSPNGVQFKVDGELDFSFGKIKAEATSQSIEWETGKKVNENPEEVLGRTSDNSESFESLVQKLQQEVPQEGGGKFKPAPKLEKPFSPADAANNVEDALKSGNFDNLKDSIKKAFEGAKGNPDKFGEFGEKLQEDLAKQGYDVRVGDNSIALHKQGEKNAVEFKVNGDIDVNSNKLDGEVSTQAYDWNTKKDVNVDPEKALIGSQEAQSESFNQADVSTFAEMVKPDEGGGKFKPARPGEHPFNAEQAVDNVEDALKSGNFDNVSDSIKKAFEDAKGDPAKFQEFGKELKEDLAKQGYNVGFGENAVAIQKQGEQNAVEFKLGGDVNVGTGKFEADIKAQSYDRQTQADVNVDPEKALFGAKEAKAEATEKPLLGDMTGFGDMFKPQEGGGKLNPGGPIEKPFNADQSVDNVEAALKSGNFDNVSDSIKKAFEDAKGDPAKFKEFGEKLQRDLAKQGYDVKFADNGVALHKQGEKNAVAFELDGDVNVDTGKFEADINPQSYDWTTKKDVAANPSDVLNGSQEAQSENTESLFQGNLESLVDLIKPEEGGGKFKPAPPTERVNSIEQSAQNVESALTNGNFEDVKSSIEKAFEGMNGNLQQFEKFGNQLKQDLAKKGFDVNFGRNRLSIHEQGSPYGVEFSVGGDMNVQTGEFKGHAKAQTFDWNTKQDVEVSPEQALELKANQAPEKADMTPEKMGQDYKNSVSSGDYSKFDSNFANSISDAHRAGGMDAVRELETNTNRNVESSEHGPIVIENGDSLQIAHATLPDSRLKPALENMSPTQLAQNGYVKHPTFGILKIESLGPKLRMQELASASN